MEKIKQKTKYAKTNPGQRAGGRAGEDKVRYESQGWNKRKRSS